MVRGFGWNLGSDDMLVHSYYGVLSNDLVDVDVAKHDGKAY